MHQRSNRGIDRNKDILFESSRQTHIRAVKFSLKYSKMSSKFQVINYTTNTKIKNGVMIPLSLDSTWHHSTYFYLFQEIISSTFPF